MNIEIINAEYGSESKYIDVTDILKKENGPIVVSNAFFQKDPHWKRRKRLKIKYRKDGEIINTVFFENDIVDLNVLNHSENSKIYDCFPFFNEYEVLDIRLNEMFDIVEKFVIVEANRTHTGIPKDSNFLKNKHLYTKFLHKIEYKFIEFPYDSFKNPWEPENYQREFILNILKELRVDNDSLIIVSDCDEIPCQKSILRHIQEGTFSKSKRIGLSQPKYNYKINLLGNEYWNKGYIIPYGIINTSLTWMRNRPKDYSINCGWHFSWLGDESHLNEKMESVAESRKIKHILNTKNTSWDKLIQDGTYFLTDEKLKRVEIDETFPKFVQDNRHLLLEKKLIIKCMEKIFYIVCDVLKFGDAIMFLSKVVSYDIDVIVLTNKFGSENRKLLEQLLQLTEYKYKFVDDDPNVIFNGNTVHDFDSYFKIKSEYKWRLNYSRTIIYQLDGSKSYLHKKRNCTSEEIINFKNKFKDFKFIDLNDYSTNTLLNIVDLMKNSQMFFGIDSGNSHLASLIGCPIYMIKNGLYFNFKGRECVNVYNELNDVCEYKFIKDLFEESKINNKIIRVGGRGDGGYFCIDNFKNKILISYGYGNNINFEKHALSLGVDCVYLFDHTVEYNGKDSCIFYTKEGVSGYNNHPLHTVGYHLNKLKLNNNENLILKMDVEGDEWGVFDTINTKDLNLFDQIIVEFHWFVDLNKNEFKSKVYRSMMNLLETHFIFHININSHAKPSKIIYNNIEFGNVIEVGLARKKTYFNDIVPKNLFYFRGEYLTYFHHKYNTTRLNERRVEIPIIKNFIDKQKNKKILEIGNVLSHYFIFNHDIVDRYEQGIGVINEDILQFLPEEKYDVIVSISTFEHVGVEEPDKNKDKTKLSINHVKNNCLKVGGIGIITVPLGYHKYMDSQLFNNELNFDMMYYLKRISIDNDWIQCDKKDVIGINYGTPFNNANAIFVGIIKN